MNIVFYVYFIKYKLVRWTNLDKWISVLQTALNAVQRKSYSDANSC
jgi:hypothetical protein